MKYLLILAALLGLAVTSQAQTLLISPFGGSCPTATTSVLGCVKPDGTSITISGGVISASAGSPAFSAITAGTNTAALLIGTGGSLGPSGSGTITATAVPFSGVTAATNTNALVIGTGGSLSVSGAGTIAATSSTTAVNLSGSQTANFFYASPDGSSGTGAWRAIVAADVPTLNQNTTGSAASATTATNVAGGSIGTIPYQSAANTTVFLAANTAATDQVLVSHGTGAAGLAPTLSNAPALALTNMTGTLTSPTLVTPTLGIPASGVITNLTGTCAVCTANSATTAVNLSGGGTVTGTPAASVAAIQTNSTLFTGGNGTTTFPYFMLQPSGATAETGWSTSGTFIGGNSASGFAGNFLDFHVNNAASVFSVNSAGGVTISGSLTMSSGTLSANIVSSNVVATAQYKTNTNCAGVGTAASPSVVSCTAAPAGAFSCATNASAATCTINTTIVTANSVIIVTPVADEGTRLSVTCNTAPVANAAPLLATKTAATGFTINMPTITTNPACFDYTIVN